MTAAERIAWPMWLVLQVLGEALASIVGGLLVLWISCWLIRVMAAEARGSWNELQGIARRLGGNPAQARSGRGADR